MKKMYYLFAVLFVAGVMSLSSCGNAPKPAAEAETVVEEAPAVEAVDSTVTEAEVPAEVVATEVTTETATEEKKEEKVTPKEAAKEQAPAVSKMKADEE